MNHKILDKKLYLVMAATLALSCLMGVLLLPPEALDGRLYYTQSQAQDFLNDLSYSDRHRYLLNEFVDLIFMGFYTLTFYIFFKRIYKKRRIALFALAPVLFDAIETGVIIQILMSGNLQSVPEWLGIITILKWSAVMVAIIMILWGWLNLHRSRANIKGPA